VRLKKENISLWAVDISRSAILKTTAQIRDGGF